MGIFTVREKLTIRLLAIIIRIISGGVTGFYQHSLDSAIDEAFGKDE